MDKILLELLGITYNQIEYGVYAMVLKQSGGTRRIPIIIGHLEAQAIECKLQDIKPPRPLTHDTMLKTLSDFGIELKEVFIKKLPEGVFGADLILRNGEIEKKVDSRASDAISLALRAGAPIYTSSEVMMEAGFEPNEKEKVLRTYPRKPSKNAFPLQNVSDENLHKMMQEASSAEDYERAAEIKKELDRRKEL